MNSLEINLRAITCEYYCIMARTFANRDTAPSLCPDSATCLNTLLNYQINGSYINEASFPDAALELR